MSDQRQEQRYLSYLLRLWQTSDGRRQVWRASLESPGSGERQGFASLRGLIEFLEAQMDPSDREGGGPSGHSGGGTLESV
jgi:hypothetical protein